MKKLAFSLLALTAAALATLAAPLEKVNDLLLFKGEDLHSLWNPITTPEELDFILQFRYDDDDEQMGKVIVPLLKAVGVDYQNALLAALQTARRHLSERPYYNHKKVEDILSLQYPDPAFKQALKDARSKIESEKKSFSESDLQKYDEDKQMAELLDPELSTEAKINLAVGSARRTIQFEKEKLTTSELDTYNDDNRWSTLLATLLSKDGEGQLTIIQDVIGEARRAVTLGNAILKGMDFANAAVGKLHYTLSSDSYQEPSLEYLISCALSAPDVEEAPDPDGKVLNTLLQPPVPSKYLEKALLISIQENLQKIVTHLRNDARATEEMKFKADKHALAWDQYRAAQVVGDGV